MENSTLKSFRRIIGQTIFAGENELNEEGLKKRAKTAKRIGRVIYKASKGYNKWIEGKTKADFEKALSLKGMCSFINSELVEEFGIVFINETDHSTFLTKLIPEMNPEYLDVPEYNLTKVYLKGSRAFWWDPTETTPRIEAFRKLRGAYPYRETLLDKIKNIWK